MRTVSLIFEEKYADRVFALLDSIASQAFIHDGEKQWNYLFDNGGTFYMRCEENIMHPLEKELWGEPEDEKAYTVSNLKGVMYDVLYDSDIIKTLNALDRFIILSIDISGRADSTSEIYWLTEIFLSEINGYAWDDYSEHLWTLNEIRNKIIFKGHPFFDFKGWYYENKLRGPYAQFGIIDKVKRFKDYGKYEPEKYNVINIQDNAIDDWFPAIKEMNTFFHKLSRPEKGLARCGVTLIPPKSLDIFYSIVDKYTDAIFKAKQQLLDMILKAKQDKKYIIHFGV